MTKAVFSHAHTIGRSFLRACKRFEEFETTSHCAAMPRIPHHD